MNYVFDGLPVVCQLRIGNFVLLAVRVRRNTDDTGRSAPAECNYTVNQMKS